MAPGSVVLLCNLPKHGPQEIWPLNLHVSIVKVFTQVQRGPDVSASDGVLATEPQDPALLVDDRIGTHDDWQGGVWRDSLSDEMRRA